MDKNFWFVTFVTHNSRISERMITYGVQHGEPTIFTSSEQVLITQKLLEAIQKYEAKVLAWNVLPDHVHLVIAASDEKELAELIRKIKGYSAYAYHTQPGAPLWAQKFNRQLITDEQMLANVVQYITYNHQKHAEKWGEALITLWENQLKALLEQGCISLEEIL